MNARWGLLALVALGPGCEGTRPAAQPDALDSRIPGLPWFQARFDRERESAASSSTFHDFQFSDRSAESGITFENPIVDDAGKEHKDVHYDHGTGMAAADVDGDGRLDLFFVSQLGSNALYRNLGGGRFEDVTARAGLRTSDAIGVAAAFADIDNDGDPDLFVTTVRKGNRLYENTGRVYRDVTKAAGVGYVGHSSGAVFFDYDRDGLVDLFVTNVGRYTTDARGRGGYYVGLADAFMGHAHPDRAEASILYRNLGGNRFQDVSRRVGLVDRSWSGDATTIDANGDGWLDLYVLSMQGPNHLWINREGREFRDATAEYFPATPWGAMGVKSFDFDGDGRLDLFVTDMHSDMHSDVDPMDQAGEMRKADSTRMMSKFFPSGRSGYLFGNALFANRATGYTEVSDSVGLESYWPWGPSVDDVNADGWDDVFIASSMNFPYRYAPNVLLLNQAGLRFLPSAFLLGLEPRPGGVTQKLWFTLECTGADANHLFCIGCGRPEIREPACGRIDSAGTRSVIGTLGSRSSLLADLDGDGDLDLVTQEFNSRPRVLLSDLASRRAVRWLTVRLEGRTSNREGLGALVSVMLPDGRRLVKPVDGKSGYLGQSALPLYFGLGDADRATEIAVAWPSGERKTVPGPIAPGRQVVITED